MLAMIQVRPIQRAMCVLYLVVMRSSQLVDSTILTRFTRLRDLTKGCPVGNAASNLMHHQSTRCPAETTLANTIYGLAGFD